ncbi:hypothetical protein OIDMADRAFT_62557 [Oidiodendron maius Zn]|uniref:Uncharacterized protein n=1 Tax=Oidiodendron maius (strain Zn) TaxID=913774 RepID=A0A0C3GPK4_OIDMZ|nr:hypothetical protein OIDMADRAFT_62557 [Oidiodendron maius Zn]
MEGVHVVPGPHPHQQAAILEHRGQEQLIDAEAVGRPPGITVQAEPAGAGDGGLDPLLEVPCKVDTGCRDGEAEVGVGVGVQDLMAVDKQRREVGSGGDNGTLGRVKEEGILSGLPLNLLQGRGYVGLYIGNDDAVVSIEEADRDASRVSIDEIEEVIGKDVEEP